MIVKFSDTSLFESRTEALIDRLEAFADDDIPEVHLERIAKLGLELIRTTSWLTKSD